jgi:hypothetical protein
MNCPICKKEMARIDSPPAYREILPKKFWICFGCDFIAIENEIAFKEQNRRSPTMPVGAKVLSTLDTPPSINPAISNDNQR